MACPPFHYRDRYRYIYSHRYRYRYRDRGIVCSVHDHNQGFAPELYAFLPEYPIFFRSGMGIYPYRYPPIVGMGKCPYPSIPTRWLPDTAYPIPDHPSI